MRKMSSGMASSLFAKLVIFLGELHFSLEEGEMTPWEGLKVVREWLERAEKALRRDLDDGLRVTMARIVFALRVEEQMLSFSEDKAPISRWWAGAKFEREDFDPEVELCIHEEIREDEFVLPDAWWEDEEKARRQLNFDLRELDKQNCKRFCIEANRCGSYARAVWMARAWGRKWAAKQIRHYESWAKARNYLNKVVWARWPMDAALREDFWQDKPLRKSFPLPKATDPAWKWEAVLRECETSEEDVFSLAAENRLESLEGMKEAQTKALLEAFEGETMFDVDFQDLLDVVDERTAYLVYGGELKEEKPEEWAPSAKHLAMDPVKTYRMPEEEMGDLLGNQKLSRMQGARMAPEAILAWLGDLRK